MHQPPSIVMAVNIKNGATKMTTTTSLTDDQIRRLAPAVFAENPASDVSTRYAMVPTIDIINGLRSEGFMPVSASQAKTRKIDGIDTARHVIRFRRDDSLLLDGNHIETVLMNSHNRTSSALITCGVFRLVCSNGMVVGKTIEECRVRHTGNAVDDVIEGSYKVIENQPLVESSIQEMAGIKLTEQAQLALASASVPLIYPDETTRPEVRLHDLIRPGRWEDRKDDLWTTFNRIQENTMRGGVRTVRNTDHGHQTRRTRRINGVARGVDLNRQLWDLAATVASMVTGTATAVAA